MANFMSVTISRAAFFAVGWDDTALTPELQRERRGRDMLLTATPETLLYAANLLSDKGDASDTGEGEHASTRRSAKLAGRKIRMALKDRGFEWRDRFQANGGL